MCCGPWPRSSLPATSRPVGDTHGSRCAVRCSAVPRVSRSVCTRTAPLHLDGLGLQRRQLCKSLPHVRPKPEAQSKQIQPQARRRGEEATNPSRARAGNPEPRVHWHWPRESTARRARQLFATADQPLEAEISFSHATQQARSIPFSARLVYTSEVARLRSPSTAIYSNRPAAPPNTRLKMRRFVAQGNCGTSARPAQRASLRPQAPPPPPPPAQPGLPLTFLSIRTSNAAAAPPPAAAAASAASSALASRAIRDSPVRRRPRPPLSAAAASNTRLGRGEARKLRTDGEHLITTIVAKRTRRNSRAIISGQRDSDGASDTQACRPSQVNRFRSRFRDSATRTYGRG